MMMTYIYICDHFKCCFYYTLLDWVVVNLCTRYEANLNELFSVVWKYPNMSSEDVRFAAKELAERYSVDVIGDLVGELEHLKAIHAANLGDVALSPLDLLNSLHTLKLNVLFPNIIVILRIFCTLP